MWIYLPIQCTFVRAYFLTNRFVAAKSERKHKQMNISGQHKRMISISFGNFTIRFEFKFAANVPHSIGLSFSRLAPNSLKMKHTHVLRSRNLMLLLIILLLYSKNVFNEFYSYFSFSFLHFMANKINWSMNEIFSHQLIWNYFINH